MNKLSRPFIFLVFISLVFLPVQDRLRHLKRIEY